MILSRLCKDQYRGLDGEGPLRHGGRWTSKGKRVVYTASCGALAALEYRAQLGQAKPKRLFLLRIEVPDHLPFENVGSTPGAKPLFKKFGDEWLERGEKPLLRVPSVLVPYQWNFLINPMHPSMNEISIMGEELFIYDPRVIAS